MNIAGGNRAGLVLALVCSVQFVDVLGVTVLVVALPTVQRDLGVDPATLSWIAGAYPLFFGGLLVAGGRVVDTFGRRRVFLAGTLVVTAASVVCALAQHGVTLLVGRAVQGIGAAVAVPAALAVLLAAFPSGPRRTRALGVWTLCGALGGAGGFVLGGLVTQVVGWRWLFAALVPVGVAVVILARRAIDAGKGTPARPDVLGAILVTGAALLLILGFTRAGEYGFGDWTAWLPSLLSAACATVFLAVQRSVADPLVPPWVWTVPSLALGALVALVLTFTTSGANVVGTLFLQQVLGLSAGVSGAVFLLFSAAVAAGSTVASRVVRRVGRVSAMVGGLVVVASAMPVSAIAVDRRALALFMVGLVGSGLGLGVASVASTAHGTSTTVAENAGLFGGILNAAAQIGTAVGIAVLLAGVSIGAGLAAGSPDANAWGQVVAYLIAGTLALLTAALVVLLARRSSDGPARRSASSQDYLGGTSTRASTQIPHDAGTPGTGTGFMPPFTPRKPGPSGDHQ
ncbi:MFS transporter [Micromonospora sp. WMMD1082]|uniref:MFS transporter n=1 Tax=Micromonospora sp. WMMD1082 TaxID=3016104 RepID=UPI002417AED8|nr:MFS transporter [Micromonospora sp. WMMD1082]MDG4795676.1 MFS transporter [Micromonospora sp. WMMD1082]